MMDRCRTMARGNLTGGFGSAGRKPSPLPGSLAQAVPDEEMLTTATTQTHGLHQDHDLDQLALVSPHERGTTSAKSFLGRHIDQGSRRTRSPHTSGDLALLGSDGIGVDRRCRDVGVAQPTLNQVQWYTGAQRVHTKAWRKPFGEAATPTMPASCMTSLM